MRIPFVLLTAVLLSAPSSAFATTTYHFALENQNGTAGPHAPTGFVGSFVTPLNPLSGDNSQASTLQAHRWLIDENSPGSVSPLVQPFTGVDVTIDDAGNQQIRIFGGDVLARYDGPAGSVHAGGGNFAFDLTVKNSGFVNSNGANPLGGDIYAQVGDPANLVSGFVNPLFLQAADADTAGKITMTTAVYTPLSTELGLVPASSLFLGFVPQDSALRILAAFESTTGFVRDGVIFRSGFDISGTLTFLGQTGGAEVPEPGTLWLFGSAMVALARRTKRLV